jgi:hypothetical protein
MIRDAREGLPQLGFRINSIRLCRSDQAANVNPAVLRQQMGHNPAVMTARYTGEIRLDKVHEAFCKMELGK